MHYGSVRDVLDKKGENLDFSMRLKFAIDTAKGMYVHVLISSYIINLIPTGNTYTERN